MYLDWLIFEIIQEHKDIVFTHLTADTGVHNWQEQHNCLFRTIFLSSEGKTNGREGRGREPRCWSYPTLEGRPSLCDPGNVFVSIATSSQMWSRRPQKGGTNGHAVILAIWLADTFLGLCAGPMGQSLLGMGGVGPLFLGCCVAGNLGNFLMEALEREKLWPRF